MSQIINRAVVPNSSVRKVTGAPLLMREAAPPAITNDDIHEYLRRIDKRIADMFDDIHALRLAATRSVMGGPRITRTGTVTNRRDFENSQMALLRKLEAAFIAVYPDTRLTLAVLRCRGRPDWMVDARSRFVVLVKKWRPDITSAQLAYNWSKDPTTIYHLHLRGDGLPEADAMEDQWLSELKTAGLDLTNPEA